MLPSADPEELWRRGGDIPSIAFFASLRVRGGGIEEVASHDFQLTGENAVKVIMIKKVPHF